MYPNGIVGKLRGRKLREQLLIPSPRVRVYIDAAHVDDSSDTPHPDFKQE